MDPDPSQRYLKVSQSQQYCQSDMGHGLSRVRKTVTFFGEVESNPDEVNVEADYVESSVWNLLRYEHFSSTICDMFFILDF